MTPLLRARSSWLLLSLVALPFAFNGCSSKESEGEGQAGEGPGEPTAGTGALASAGAGAGGESSDAAGAHTGGRADGGAAGAAGAGGEGGAEVLYDFLGPTSLEVTEVTELVALDAFKQVTTDGDAGLLLLVGEGEDGQSIEKYDEDFEEVWTLGPLAAQNGDPLSLLHVTAGPEGSVFVAGSTPSALTGEVGDSGGGLLLGRFKADKQLDWLTKTSGGAIGRYVSLATGKPAVWGNGEALPGQPVDVFGGPFLAHFDDAGQLASAKQAGDYREQSLYPTLMPDGSLFIVNQYVDSNNAVAHYTPEGVLDWEYPPADVEGLTFPPALAASAERGYALMSYGFSSCGVSELLDTGLGWGLGGEQVDVPASGDDPAYQGSFLACDVIAATSRDIYVAGIYQTVTDEGGSAWPFVARVTPQGKQRWFRQLALPEGTEAITHLVVRQNGNVVVAGASGFAFELRGKDGAPLSSSGAEQ